MLYINAVTMGFAICKLFGDNHFLQKNVYLSIDVRLVITKL